VPSYRMIKRGDSVVSLWVKRRKGRVAIVLAEGGGVFFGAWEGVRDSPSREGTVGEPERRQQLYSGHGHYRGKGG